MAFVAECARYVQNTGNTATITQSFTHSVSVGRTLVLAVNAPVTGAVTAWAVSDSKGNTWTVRQSENATPVNYQLAVATCTVTTALTTSDTYTVTVTGASPAKWSVIAASFDDVTGYDTGAVGSGTTTSLSVSTAGSAQSKELVVGAFAYTDTVAQVGFSPGAGFTTVGSPAVASATSAPRSLVLEWQYVNTSGARTASGLLGAGEGWGGVVLALKQQSAVVNRRVKTASGYTALTTRVA